MVQEYCVALLGNSFDGDSVFGIIMRQIPICIVLVCGGPIMVLYGRTLCIHCVVLRGSIGVVWYHWYH